MNYIKALKIFATLILIGMLLSCNNDDADIIIDEQTSPKRIVEITGGANYSFQYGTEPNCNNCFDEVWGDVRILEKHGYNSNGELISIDEVNHLGELTVEVHRV